jgi:parvulin-like peptidyl-prolyl isomerase
MRKSPITPLATALLASCLHSAQALAGPAAPLDAATADGSSVVGNLSSSLSSRNPEVAAEVDGRPILRKQVELITAARAGDDLPSLDKEDIKLLKKQVLDDLIDRQLLLDAARAQAAPPSPKEVQLKLSQALKPEPGSNSKAKVLGQATEDALREGLRDDLWIQAYFSAIESKTSADDGELRAVYSDNLEKFREPEQMHLRQIVISPDEPDKFEDTRSRALEIMQQIRSAQLTFDDAVRQFSSGPARDRGGDMGFVSTNQIPADFIPKLKAQELGIVGEPLISSAGVHLILVLERRGGAIRPFEEIAEDLRRDLIRRKRDLEIESTINAKRLSAKIIRYLD